MLEPIIAFFERLISDFSWRRLLFVLSLLGITIFGLWVYESYTGSFQLARIDKEVTLLERLAAVSDQKQISGDSNLRSIYNDLQRKLASSATPSDSLTVLSPAAKKSLASAVAWFALAMLIFLAGRSGSTASQFTGATALGMVVFATPFVVLAAFLPTFEASWINYVLYPVGQVVLVVVLVLGWQRLRAKPAKPNESPS